MAVAQQELVRLFTGDDQSFGYISAKIVVEMLRTWPPMGARPSCPMDVFRRIYPGCEGPLDLPRDVAEDVDRAVCDGWRIWVELGRPRLS